MEELWFISGKSESRTVLPIHDLVNEIDTDFIDILPAIHTLVVTLLAKWAQRNKLLKKEIKTLTTYYVTLEKMK